MYVDDDAVIIDALRTPIGGAGGILANYKAPELAALVIEELLKRIKTELPLGELILGHVMSEGVGQNPARQVVKLANLPYTISAYSLNMLCGSGLKAVANGFDYLKYNKDKAVIVGGMESTSNVPYLLEATKYKRDAIVNLKEIQDTELYGVLKDALICPFSHEHMVKTIDDVAREFNITREEQDNFAYQSHQRVLKAISEGKFKTEILPTKRISKDGIESYVLYDELPRDLPMEKIKRWKATVWQDPTKPFSVTGANTPPPADGACALILAPYKLAKDLNLNALAKIKNYSVYGESPRYFARASYHAINELMKKDGTNLVDYDLIEVNEAFAAQLLILDKMLNFDKDKLNVNGGAIAMGHPFGMTGARLVTTLTYNLIDRNKKLGLASICLGGGNAIALSVERL